MRASTRQWSCTHTQTHARISLLSLTRARTHARTGTCSDYCLPRLEWSCESASVLRFTYIACLVSFVCVRPGYLDRRLFAFVPYPLWTVFLCILLFNTSSAPHSKTHFLNPTPKSKLVRNTQLYERFVLHCVWCWHILFHSYRFLTYKGGFLCC
jgi:hypothetical protein